MSKQVHVESALRALIRSKGLSQLDLSLVCGVTQPLVSYWLSGVSKPTAHHMQILARILGVKPPIEDMLLPIEEYIKLRGPIA